MESKNQPNNLNKSVISILILVSISLGGYVLFNKKHNLINIEDNTTEQKIDTQSKLQTAECDKTAKKYFDTWQPFYSDGFSNFDLSYKNNYNKNNNSCYVLISYNLKLADNSDGSSSQKITYTLADVSKKDPDGKNYLILGSYSQSISSVNEINNRLDTCIVSGTQCYSLEGFLSSITPYFAN